MFIRANINNSLFFCSSSEPEELNQDGCCGSQETSAEQPSRSKETKSTDECKICYEASVDCVLYVCGHMCICYEVDILMLKAVLLKIRTPPPHILAPWIRILVAKYHSKHTEKNVCSESSKFLLVNFRDIDQT